MSDRHQFMWRPSSEPQRHAIQQLVSEPEIEVSKSGDGYEISVVGDSFDEAQDVLQKAYARYAEPEGFIEVLVEED